MLPGALEAENAALRSELGRRMEEVARLLELEGGQNQLLREQLDKRGVEVRRMPNRRNDCVKTRMSLGRVLCCHPNRIKSMRGCMLC
jgi:hypothetical protein